MLDGNTIRLSLFRPELTQHTQSSYFSDWPHIFSLVLCVSPIYKYLQKAFLSSSRDINWTNIFYIFWCTCTTATSWINPPYPIFPIFHTAVLLLFRKTSCIYLSIYLCGTFNKFPYFFVQAFKIVVDSWKFSILLLYILWDDWPIFMISGSNEQLQQQLEYTWLSQLVNFKNVIWTWGHFRRTICNKILL